MSFDGKTSGGPHKHQGTPRVEGAHSFEMDHSSRHRAFSCVKNKSADHADDGTGMRPRTFSMPAGSNINKPSFSVLQNRYRGRVLGSIDHDPDIYTVRMFEVNSKGVIKRRSDSWRSRSTASFSSEGEPCPLSPSSAASSSSQDSIGNFSACTVGTSIIMVLGAEGVGKTALTQQFMTTEYLGGFDTSSGKFFSPVVRHRSVNTVKPALVGTCIKTTTCL